MKQRIIKFWKSGLTGKIVIGCGIVYSIVGLLAICMIIGALLWPLYSPQRVIQPQVTPEVVTENLPTPTPMIKGPQIAFTAPGVSGNLDIYAIDIDGGEQINLTNYQAWDDSPDWSPDGKHIVFMSERNGDGEIYVMNADGSEQINLSNHPGYDSNPVWSPTGDRIAFVSTRDNNDQDNGEIYVMNSDGGGQVNLTNHPAHDDAPAWSPDGNYIAFVSFRDGDDGGEIYVMKSDGSQVIGLTNHPNRNEDPAWSPDGKQIAFTSYRNGKPEIYIMDTNGNEPINVTNNPEADYEPSWSSDGKQLAFISTREGSPTIYIINLETKETKHIAVLVGDSSNPVWMPDETMRPKELAPIQLPVAEASITELDSYYLNIFEQGTVLSEATIKIYELIKSSDMSPLEQVSGIGLQATKIETIYETIKKISPPPEAIQIHNGLLDAATDCHQFNEYFTKAVKNQGSEEDVNKSGLFLKSCMEKLNTSMEKVENYLVTNNFIETNE